MRRRALSQDAQHIRRAIELAKRAEGFTHPNPMVGCVLVKDGRTIAEGWHKGPGQEHAEAMALRLAGAEARGATAYVTLEPCNHYGRTPPCAKALIGACVAEVVYGFRDLNDLAEGGAQTLRDFGIGARLVADREARRAAAELVRPWVHGLTCWRPWVSAKLAMSLDGYTALPSGESKWITSEPARRRGHDLRQRVDALLVGVGTVLADDPGLDARPEGRQPAPHLKVVLDSALRTPPSARLLGTPGPVLIIASSAAESAAAERLQEAGAEVMHLGEPGRPDLKTVLRDLKDRGVTDLMIEGGGTLLGSAFDAGVVDEVWAFIAPVLFGAGRPAIAGQGPERLADAFRLSGTTTEQLGSDILIRGVRERKAS